MTTETIIANTKQMIDDLKTVCANFGLGNASSEYKIITEIFLYKFLNDKFLYEVQQADERLKDSENVEQTLNNMPEDDYEMLKKRMEEVGLDEENYQFYLDLRKYGSTHHSGFGLGFERCVMYLTGISNIRDAIPFPRTVNNCEL